MVGRAEEFLAFALEAERPIARKSTSLNPDPILFSCRLAYLPDNANFKSIHTCAVSSSGFVAVVASDGFGRTVSLFSIEPTTSSFQQDLTFMRSVQKILVDGTSSATTSQLSRLSLIVVLEGLAHIFEWKGATFVRVHSASTLTENLCISVLRPPSCRSGFCSGGCSSWSLFLHFSHSR